jgi:hypothetical protein
MWLPVSWNRNGWNAPSNNGTPEPRATGWSFTTSSSISGRSAPASFPPPHSQMSLPSPRLSSRTAATGSPRTTSTAGSGGSAMVRETTYWRSWG